MTPLHQLWANRLQRFRQANISAAQFCLNEGISKANFFKWKRRLSQEKPATHTLVPIALTPSQTAPRTSSTAAAASAAIELVMSSGHLLRLPTDYSPQQIAQLVVAIEEAHSC
jgi:hypothetical protein